MSYKNQSLNTEIDIFNLHKENIFIEGKYQGNNYYIYPAIWGYSKLTVNWYGQLIEFKNLKFPFNVYIEVNQGQPFTPLAPIRKTLVENNQIKVFINSLVKKLTERYTDESLTPSDLNATNLDIFIHYCKNNSINVDIPWIVLAKYKNDSDIDHTDDDEQIGNLELFKHNSLPLILEPDVVLTKSKECQELSTIHQYGLSSFIETLDISAYQVVNYLKKDFSCNKSTIYWQPGEKHELGSKSLYLPIFYERGKYCISSKRTNSESLNWEPLTEDVYTLDEKYSEVPSEFCFGCEDINTVFTEYVWSGFSYHDDEDYDIQETSYQDSINWCLAQIFNGIQKNEINKSTINSFLANHHSIPITEINNCGIVFLEDDKAQIFRHLDDGKTDLLTDVKLF